MPHIIRMIGSALMVAVILLSLKGIAWTMGDTGPAQANAARFVLSCCALSGVVGLIGLWSTRHRQHAH